jgi:hypothetical protein
MAHYPSFSDRISKVSEILNVPPTTVSEILKKEGLEDTPSGISLLNAPTTTVDDLIEILQTGIPEAKKLQVKAAASALKGDDPLQKNPEPRVTSAIPTEQVAQPHLLDQIAQPLVEYLKSSKPIQQWSDKELLERYAEKREYEVEQELNLRSKNQPFIILLAGKHEPGKEAIDIEASLELLKSARKRTNPTMIPHGETVVQVYRIAELNLQDRIMEICPICGQALYKGYCEKCQVNFASVGDDERAYIKLMSGSDNFNAGSFSDRKHLIASASKGLDDLKITWPGLAKKFDELRLTGDLPKLRIVANRPSSTVADPFFQDGNRAFGNRKF